MELTRAAGEDVCVSSIDVGTFTGQWRLRAEVLPEEVATPKWLRALRRHYPRNFVVAKDRRRPSVAPDRT